MSELVDRDAVREFIMSYSHSTDVVFHMEKHLYEVPTIDAVPVVHGEWERELDVHDEPFYQCSVCGECFDSNRDSTHEVFKYCPDCGARMDGERREG